MLQIMSDSKLIIKLMIFESKELHKIRLKVMQVFLQLVTLK